MPESRRTTLHDRVAEAIAQCIDGDWAICGVPCSVLEPWLQQIDGFSDRELIASNEGHALAFCAGAWLAGDAGVAYMQNSGLGNAVNALTSLIAPFEIPVICLIGWRGVPGVRDEPQHRVMGSITTQILSLCKVTPFYPAQDDEALENMVAELRTCVKNRQSCALLLPPTSWGKVHRLDGICTRSSDYPLRLHAAGHRSRDSFHSHAVLEMCCREFEFDSVFVATTGHNARELYAMDDGPNKFYMVGSMGHAGALALGIANRSQRRVIVIDGDGALLMHLGSMAMAGAFRGSCFTHVLMRNGVHESTGCQPIAGGGATDFKCIAASCGYLNAWRCDSLDDLRDYLRAAYVTAGPSFIEVPVTPRTARALPRIPDRLPDLALRLRNHLSATDSRFPDRRLVHNSQRQGLSSHRQETV
jgi:phosphonopyruvate decarboxylase